MAMDNKIMGDRLSKIRGWRGKTQDEVAAHLNLSREAISRREQGNCDISLVEAIKLMRFLHFRIEIFCSDDFRMSDGLLPD
jgi:DNA-binding XRE family transcriptional regulator